MPNPHLTALRRLTGAALAATLLGLTLAAAPRAVADDSAEPTPSATAEKTAEPAQGAESAEPRQTTDATPEPSVSDEASATPSASTTATAVAPASASTRARAKAAVAAITHSGVQHTTTDGASYWVPATWKEGEALRISGSGWLNTAGTAGSVIAVKLDAGAVSTTGTVTNPATGLVVGNKTIWAIVRADDAGDWELDLPFPALTNGTQAWAAGESHSLTLLSGSLLAGDVVRSGAGSLTIATAATAEPEPTDSTPTEPTWAHETVTAADTTHGRTATAWVESQVSTAAGSTIRIVGTGWVNQAGTGASTVAIKLAYGDGAQYARSGSDVVSHPSASGDDTIWALLAPSNPSGNAHVFTLDDDGDFSIGIDTPSGLVAGQYLTVRFQSGRFDSADTVRSVVTDPLVVGGVAWTGDDDEEQTTCVPTSSAPTVTVENPALSTGDALHVTGTGWCHPTDGGSVIAIKLDEGAYSRLDTSVHANKTIWAIIHASDTDGTFDVQLTLPDGTTTGANGSTPAFPTGAHTLRLLSGSLKTGDTSRTLESATFVVGDYSPSEVPDPPEATEDLTTATRGGVSLALGTSTLTVSVPGAVEGDWIYLNVFHDGSPSFPWAGTWFRADATGTVTASLSGITLPEGTSKLSVQSGNNGALGTLLGWAPLKVAVTDEDDDTTTTTTSTIVRYVGTATAPTKVPAAPVERASQLSDRSDGGATATLKGTKVTMTVPKGMVAEWVYVYVYTGASVAKAGWVQLDADRRFTVDLSAVGEGRHRVVAVAADATLLGWVDTVIGDLEPQEATQTEPVEDATQDQTTAPVPEAAATPPAQGGSSDGLLIGLAAAVVLGGGVVGYRLAVRAPKGAKA
ncbi:MAG: hypothetical protein QM779_01310 [Propionicimonas sp.]|uniref:hypothetical protein n=1 Tax=Propionicimonas sp. TaxID=1955623 RepID=UPI003D0E82B5